ncbi:hypothetical protein C8R44DRAFT_859515 [Mycena epipterygia]|nr:hypothetical protein C8R44DRAFT_859515 [Mycena epipterygia]
MKAGYERGAAAWSGHKWNVEWAGEARRGRRDDTMEKEEREHESSEVENAGGSAEEEFDTVNEIGRGGLGDIDDRRDRVRAVPWRDAWTSSAEKGDAGRDTENDGRGQRGGRTRYNQKRRNQILTSSPALSGNLRVVVVRLGPLYRLAHRAEVCERRRVDLCDGAMPLRPRYAVGDLELVV